MSTLIEKQIELEDLIKAEAKKQFPAMDPDWAADRILTRNHQNHWKTAKILAKMWPEVVRVSIKGDK